MREKIKDGYDAISLEHFINFVRAGGTLKIEIPKTEDIVSEISNNRPVLIPISHWFLHKNEMLPRYSIHFNIVKGYDSQNFTVNDPDFGKAFGGQHDIEKDLLMYAIYVSAKGGD